MVGFARFYADEDLQRLANNINTSDVDRLEDADVIAYTIFLVLRDALSDPGDVANLLSDWLACAVFA